MNLWKRYRKRILENCEVQEGGIRDVTYWRNYLLAIVLIYLLPCSLISIIPGIIFCIQTKMFGLIWIDLMTFTAILVTGLIGKISLHFRKLLFIGTLLFFSICLIYFTGLIGNGLLFLLVVALLWIIVFPISWAFYSVVVNTVICGMFTLGLYQQWLFWPGDHLYNKGEWITACTYLIFLNIVISALLSRLFDGLQTTINAQLQLESELKKDRQSIQQLMDEVNIKNNELSDFAFIASHDLKEPLRMVSSFLELLDRSDKEQLTEQQKKYIRFSYDGAQRMGLLINQLLEYAAAGVNEEQLQPVDTNQLMKELMLFNKPLLEETKAMVTLHALHPVYAHPVALKTVFQNLLVNAVKYRTLGIPPLISMESNTRDGWVEFKITDNGIGIAEEEQEAVFKMFKRLHASESSGTGMGLAICKKIIEQQHGRIWVESEPGRGCSFYFTLPASQNN